MSISLSTPEKCSIVQIAYLVDDIEEAANRWFRTFGVGPFLVLPHIATQGATYRGSPTSLDFTIALAQAGEIQVELIVQHGDTPSVFNEGSPGAAPRGPHHVAICPRDHDAMVASYVDRGCPVVCELLVGERQGATFVDTRGLNGHLLEIYHPNPGLEQIYATVKASAENWDRKTLLIG